MLNFELVKEHPYITVAVVGGGALLLYLYWSSASSDSSSTSSSSVGASTGTVGTTVDPNVLSAQVSESQTSTAAQLAALQSNNSLTAQVTGYGESASVSELQSNNALAATFAGFQAQDFAVGAQQQVANASTQSQIQLAEIAAGLPLSYTMAAGGPFSAQYAGQTTVGGTVPTNNPTSSPSQTITVTPNGTVPTLNITDSGPVYPVSSTNPISSTNPSYAVPYFQPIANGQNLALSGSQEVSNLSAFQGALASGYKGDYFDFIDGQVPGTNNATGY